jgi:hypothetical protein
MMRRKSPGLNVLLMPGMLKFSSASVSVNAVTSQTPTFDSPASKHGTSQAKGLLHGRGQVGGQSLEVQFGKRTSRQCIALYWLVSVHYDPIVKATCLL